MIALLTSLLAPVWRYIAAAGAAFAVVLGIYEKGRMDAAAKAKAAEADAQAKAVANVAAIRRKVDGKTDAEVKEELGKWAK